MTKTLKYCVALCLSALGAVASDLGAEGESYADAHYERFMRGVLVYQPTPGSDVGQVEIPISSLASPLDGTFDLSAFGDTSRYISIHTGYKKGKIAANGGKLEIWACPKFLGAKAPQFRDIMEQWESPVAYFWTYGGHDVAADNFDYLLKTELCMNNELNCYEKWKKAKFTPTSLGPQFGLYLTANSYFKF